MFKNRLYSKKCSQLMTVALALLLLWTCAVPAVALAAERSSGSSGSVGSFQMIAAGRNHSLALKSDGSVVAWGSNNKNQLDVPEAAQSGVVSIAAGSYHSLALKADGSVVAWGNNDYGQTTLPAAAQSGVVAIAAGKNHSLALKADGSVVAWGLNTNGQSTVPAEAQSDVTAIAGGYLHSLALKADGGVVAWGSNSKDQTTVPTAAQSRVVAIAAGDTHSLALKVDGSVVAWGSNTNGEGNVPVEAQSGVVSIAATDYNSLALKADGGVIAWGANSQGQRDVPQEAQSGVVSIAAGSSHALALKADGSVISWGLYDQSTVPAELNSPTKAIAVAAGYSHSLALKADGGVVAWGRNNYNQINVPEAAQSGVVSISTGWHHSLALKADGSVVAWGKNDKGQTNVPVEAQSGIVAIAAGANHSMALKSDGSVVAWGYNYWGQSDVPLDAQSGIVAIAAGYGHSLALKSDGSVVAWGNNADGEATVPTAAQSGVVAIAAGGYHSLALKADGSVVAWGYNLDGQVSVPTAAQNGIVAIEGGTHFSMALKMDGTVVSWGRSSEGQRSIPANAQSGVVSLAGGELHSEALKADGSIVAWGNNKYGQSTVPGSTDLITLAIDAGDLSPSFESSVTAYTYELVGSTAASLDITATLTDGDNAVLLVNAEEQPSGAPVAVGLTGDMTEILIRVEPYFLPGKTYTINVSQRYNVTYDGNGSDGGSAPADGQAYSPDDSVEVLGNTGSLRKTGYTFAGWNTAVDGSGTSCTPGEAVTIGMDNVTLYAQWLDNINPEVTVQMKDEDESPYANDTWTNRSVTVHASATDDGSGLATFQYSEDGGNSWLPVTGALTYSEEGVHTLTFRAIDEKGNEEQESRIVKINQNGLVVTINASKQDGAPYVSGDWTNQPVRAEISASHLQELTVTSVTYSLDDGAHWFTYTEPLAVSAAGTQFVKVKAADEAGNELEDALTVKIDRTSPSIDFDTNGNETWSAGGTTVVTANDAESGLSTASLAYAWSQSDTTPAEGWSPFTSGDNLAKSGVDGDWYLHVRAQDTVGNAAGAVSQRYRLDTSAAELNGLALSAGMLNSEFNASTMAYRVNVANSVKSIAITPAAQDKTDLITVSVNGGTPLSVTTGMASEALALHTGENLIEIGVTALNGARKTYTVYVQRAPGYSPEPQRHASLLIGSMVMSSVAVEKAARPDGTVMEQVMLDQATLDGALTRLAEAGQSILTIQVDDSERVVRVQLPAASIAAAAELMPNAIIEAQLNGASYQLVISVLDLAGLAEELGVDLQDLKVNIILERADEAVETQVLQLAVSKGFDLASAVIDFKVTVEANGQTVEIRDFGGTYMARAIVTGEDAVNRNLTGVLYDQGDMRFTFVPSQAGSRPDGTPETVIKVPHNSMYAVLASAGKTFDDLEGHWAQGNVELLASKLIVNGVTDTLFMPDADITRAEFTALLVRALGLSLNADDQASGFPDVAADAWYRPVIQAAVNAGLASGMTQERFAPDEPMTREQMAVMLASAMVFAGDRDEGSLQSLTKLSDRWTISSWATASVAKVVAAGIIEGMPGSMFMPFEHATRAQATAMLARFLREVGFID
ncbi:S-layer homology domain-containing protein [Paenibacillus sp. HB172176]|uniref:RCC1 domain-containing protein n=1 Tax=Paenibacillus sp. HB172176 TaxID=2493690 RepID=UPI00143A7EF9|nr:S-layer homology domain-containing protein [Paenibacillus sp. HB172176]